MAGLQSLTTSLLTQGAGAPHRSRRSPPTVEALGGTLESAGGTDGSQIVLTVLADQLGSAMPILADVALRTRPSPPPSWSGCAVSGWMSWPCRWTSRAPWRGWRCARWYSAPRPTATMRFRLRRRRSKRIDAAGGAGASMHVELSAQTTPS